MKMKRTGRFGRRPVREGDTLKKLQLKYNILMISYFFAFCAIAGYAAIFLAYKGLSNSEIGTVTGGGCLAGIFMTLFVSSMTEKFSKISLQQYLIGYMAGCAAIYLLLDFVALPVWLLMALFILMMAVGNAVVPTMTTICMNYVQSGYDCNYGVGRGLGSIAYAVAAVTISQIAVNLSPGWIPIVFLGGFIVMMIDLLSMPATYAVSPADSETPGTELIKMPAKYKTLFFLLVAFAFMMASSAALATYLPNILHSMGASDSVYGLAVFCMAVMELPFMTLAPKLMKRFGVMPLLLAGMTFFIVRNGLIAFAGNIPLLIIGMMFQGCSYGLITPVITYYIADTVALPDQIMAQTLLACMTSGIGSTTGNVVGGFLTDLFGVGTLRMFAFVLTVIGLAIAALTILPQIRRQPKPTKAERKEQMEDLILKQMVIRYVTSHTGVRYDERNGKIILESNTEKALISFQDGDIHVELFTALPEVTQGTVVYHPDSVMETMHAMNDIIHTIYG